MKILMFGWEFPPHISGGLGTACYGLTKGLNTLRDMEILFVVPKAFGDEDQQTIRLIGANDINLGEKIIDYKEFLKKISFVEINSQLIPYTSPEEYEKLIESKRTGNKELIYTRFGGKFDFSGGYTHNIFQEISNYAIVASHIGKSFKFDVIHAHDWLTYPAGIAAKHVSGKPLVIHVHATDFDRSGGSVNPGVFEIEKRGMEIADKIIAVSNLTRNTIINNYHIDPAKVETVYNAVDSLDDWQPSSEFKKTKEYVVTFLGRVTLQKGPEYFIEAAHRVLQKMGNVRFVMAGSGELLNRSISRIAELQIGDRFHFTGFLKGDDVRKMFAVSNVYVMPSVSEPFGISPLEAMQSNVPVIISRQSGVSEILKHAIKVDFWDIEAMADAIYGILNYRGLSQYFRRYGKSEVENLKWENTAVKVREIYNSLAL
ncbi:MAG: glycosyltransferase family 4 protein [Bacteroidales bacterium]|nr:glycosyltransferase family 4 protein [Bacteroidales bacterium]